jgi:2-polyprenyl-3-methyl-5-hydroxy-6-metoxy-1,4-benzoquinol methylase
MSTGGSSESEIQSSWARNADAWTAAVRDGKIESRRAGTDAAIVAACERAGLGRVLDVGCGEGWLARELAARGARVLGIDGSGELIARAREAGGAATYEQISYDGLVARGDLAAGPWDVVVCNFSLLAEDLAPLLASLSRRLAPNGTLLIQTVHPWVVGAAAPPYGDGWRVETFASMQAGFAAPMPWYFRTLSSWLNVVRKAGLTITGLQEPRHADTGTPLSLLLQCRDPRDASSRRLIDRS